MVRTKVLEGGEQKKKKIQIRERERSPPPQCLQSGTRTSRKEQDVCRDQAGQKNPRGVNQQGPQRPGGPVHAGAVESKTE